MDLMTFISENYVALILVLVIILMTIIGYFADKKYTNNSIEKPKKKERKSKEVVDEALEENNDFDMPVDIEPVVDTFDSYPDSTVEEKVEPVQPEPIIEDVIETVQPEPIVDSFDMPSYEDAEVVNNEIIDENIDKDLSNDSESVESTIIEEPSIDSIDTTENTGELSNDSTESQVVEEVNNNELAFDTEIYNNEDEEESEWTTVSQTSEPVEDTSENSITFDGVVDEDFNLPNIDKLNDELASVEDDDDVWKF